MGFLLLMLSAVIACSCWGRHVGSLQHERADRLVGLHPGLVIGWSPALSQKVGEGFQQDRSDDGIVLWQDTIADMPLAQALEGARQHLWLPEVLDHQGQRSQQFLALLLHVRRGKEGSRLGKARKESFIEGSDKCLSAWGNCLKTALK